MLINKCNAKIFLNQLYEIINQYTTELFYKYLQDSNPVTYSNESTS